MSLFLSILTVLAMMALGALVTLPTPSWAAGSGGGGGSLNPSTTAADLTPEEQSERALMQGIKYRDRGLKHEAKAAQAKTEKRRAKSLRRAEKAFAKALEQQKLALKLNPNDPRVANELGYAYRKTGDFRKAIGAYNLALDLDPSFHRATEYRGQAFLALGLLDMTKQAYMTLFKHDLELAGELMQAIEDWAAERTDLTEEETAFVAWSLERKALATTATKLSLVAPSSPSSQKTTW